MFWRTYTLSDIFLICALVIFCMSSLHLFFCLVFSTKMMYSGMFTIGMQSVSRFFIWYDLLQVIPVGWNECYQKHQQWNYFTFANGDRKHEIWLDFRKIIIFFTYIQMISFWHFCHFYNIPLRQIALSLSENTFMPCLVIASWTGSSLHFLTIDLHDVCFGLNPSNAEATPV